MTTDEAAVVLGVSLGWMEKLIDGGVLRLVEADGEVRVRAKDVKAYASCGSITAASGWRRRARWRLRLARTARKAPKTPRPLSVSRVVCRSDSRGSSCRSRRDARSLAYCPLRCEATGSPKRWPRALYSPDG